MNMLPDSLSLELGALVEPLSVALHAVRRAQLLDVINPRVNILIIGAGPIGLLCAAVCRSHGMHNVNMTDIRRQRLAFAFEHNFAAFTSLLPQPNIDASTTEEKLRWAEENAKIARYGLKFDIVFECTGTGTAAQTALFAARSGGKVVLVGMGSPLHALPVAASVVLREIDVVGSFRYAGEYAKAIQMLGDEKHHGFRNQVAKLITHRFKGFKHVKEAFEMASGGQELKHPMMKVLIEFV